LLIRGSIEKISCVLQERDTAASIFGGIRPSPVARSAGMTKRVLACGSPAERLHSPPRWNFVRRQRPRSDVRRRKTPPKRKRKHATEITQRKVGQGEAKEVRGTGSEGGRQASKGPSFLRVEAPGTECRRHIVRKTSQEVPSNSLLVPNELQKLL